MRPRPASKLILSLLGALASAVALFPAAAAADPLEPPAGSLQEHSLGGRGTFAHALTVGPDGKIWFGGTCAGGAAAQSCGGVLRLRAGGTQVGSRTYSFLTGETRWVAVRLNPRGLRLLTSGPTKAQVELTVEGVGTTTAAVLLYRPRNLRHHKRHRRHHRVHRGRRG